MIEWLRKCFSTFVEFWFVVLILIGMTVCGFLGYSLMGNTIVGIIAGIIIGFIITFFGGILFFGFLATIIDISEKTTLMYQKLYGNSENGCGAYK